jgi:threonine synthase
MKLIEQKRIGPQETTVIGITGNGYKASDIFSSQLQVDAVLLPKLSVFRQWYEQLQPVHVRARL